jgi:stage V sporulation protein G
VQITEVRIKLMEDSDDRLQAFCSITFDDCFVVRDLKIIEGASGPFVAMPSRKLTAHCPHCGTKNHLRAGHCNNCGTRLKEDRSTKDAEGRCKLYADIAHPINSACREMIQQRVIAEFQAERDRAQQPGYASRYDDDYGPDEGPDADFEEPVARRAAPPERTAERAIERATVERAAVERTHVQPAEREPRPPHTPAARSEAGAAAQSGRRRGNEGFGAGIF